MPTGRELVRAMLEECGLEPLTDDATLITAELLGNAIRHGEDVVLLVYVDRERKLNVQVWDPGPGEPRVGAPEELDEGGRGLMLVEALADEWGSMPDVLGGKVVWARVG
ncbi:ATP-binding protein [Actinomadura barringtoniae]|uniref:ATP-binding protein n=1 Tax=Actinomadura barringtoniae TaxID=1427535 RepID=A0A939P8N7_9ACTN|nr:ATP-binding protein [Actinomadura barringtoniae]